MTNKLRLLVGTVGPALITLTLAGDACASPSGGHGGEEHHGITLFNWPSDSDPRIGLVWILINFVVLVLLLNKLIFRNLVQSNAERHDAIKRELEQATEARAKADAVLAEYKSKIDALEGETRSILGSARASAEEDRKQILAEAEAEAAKIVKAANAAAEREAASRRQAIEAEIVGAAIERARELLISRFNDADQRRLVDGYATDLSTTSLKDAR
ncbi:MAG: ATP synthase F0 subunit B [Myxococcales bacterium]|nr:ATP synthase F0 subunit B [Myxococcales bacterium]